MSGQFHDVVTIGFVGRTVLDRSFGDVAVDGGRSLAAFAHLLPGVFKVARGKHFAAEVRQVEGFAANRLIDAVQLAQGERGAEQSGGHVGVFDFGAQAEQRVVDDLAMVERQLGQFVFGEPSYVVTVLEARGLQYTTDTMGNPPWDRVGPPKVYSCSRYRGCRSVVDSRAA